MSELLVVQQLNKTYGSDQVVHDVSFALKKGTSTALIGPNGAGKTTTLSMLAGLLVPTSGSIQLQGVDGDVRREIGFLPQYPKFFPWLTAIEFTEMAAKISGVSAREARKEAEKTLAFVGLQEAMHKKTGTFSGGMKQRLGLAQAIVHQPKLLLLDEPVSALDPVGRREVMDLLKGLLPEMTILYSTHILNDAEEMTDQLLFLRKGELVEQGSLQSVRDKYAEQRIRIEFSSEENARSFVESTNWTIDRDRLVATVTIVNGQPSMNEVLASITTSGWDIRKVEKQSVSLEEIFLKVAGRS